MRFSAILLAVLISVSAFAQPTVTGPSAGVFNVPVASGATFNPATDPTTVEYLTADGITGVADGGGVGTWNHTVGNDGIQGSGVQRGILHSNYLHGLPIVSFTNTTQFTYVSNSMPGTLTQPFVYTAVFQFPNTNTSVGYFVVDGNQAANRVAIQNDSATEQLAAYAGTASIDLTKWNQNWHVLSVVFNGASSTWWIDGQNKGSLSATPGGSQSVGFTIGQRYSPLQSGNVNVASFMVSSAVPSAGMLALQQYFTNRWAVVGP